MTEPLVTEDPNDEPADDDGLGIPAPDPFTPAEVDEDAEDETDDD